MAIILEYPARASLLCAFSKNDYNNFSGKLISVTRNGMTETKVYDELDRIIAIKYNNVVKYRYVLSAL